MTPEQASVMAAVEECRADARALAHARRALRRRGLVVQRQGSALLVLCPLSHAVKFQTNDTHALAAWARVRA